MRRGRTWERKCSLCVRAITTKFSVYSPPEVEVRFVKVWWVDFGWTLSGHLAALSLPSSAGKAGENIRWKKLMGRRWFNKAKAKAMCRRKENQNIYPLLPISRWCPACFPRSRPSENKHQNIRHSVLTPLSHSLSFYCWADISWFGISLWSVQDSCPVSVPSQNLIHAPAYWWGGECWGDNTDDVGVLLSSSQNTGVLPTPLQLPMQSIALWGLLREKILPISARPKERQKSIFVHPALTELQHHPSHIKIQKWLKYSALHLEFVS